MDNSNEKKTFAIRRRAYITSAIFLAIFAAQLIWVLQYSVIEFELWQLWVASPAVIALFILIMAFARIYEKYFTMRFFSIFLLVISVIIMLFSWFLYTFSNDSCTVIKYYRQCLNLCDYPKNEYVAHFPKKITDDMQNARLHLDIFWGRQLVLVYKTTPDELEQLKQKFEPQVKYIGSSDFSFVDKTILEYSSVECSYTEQGSKEKSHLPDDFTVWVFDSSFQYPDISKYEKDPQDTFKYKAYPKGHIYGVAFSDERCEISYFYNEFFSHISKSYKD